MQNNIYIAPDGKVYKRVGISLEDLPEFGSNNAGKLIYRYNNYQEYHPFTLDENGNLLSDYWELNIGDDGSIVDTSTWELVTDTGVDATIQKYMDLIRSHNKKVRLKVSLLDNYYNVVDSLEGKIKGVPSYDMESDSEIRRTCSITLTVSIKEHLTLDFENTWNNRMVELACGLYDWDSKEYVWFNLGRMLMTSGESVYDAVTQDIKLNLVDLMAAMTQERGNQIGFSYSIPAGSNIKTSIEQFVAENTPFGRTQVCAFDDTIPYDLSSNPEDYPVDVLKQIFDLFPYYEYFYDSDGKFVVQKIPMKISDPIDFSKEFLDDLLISEKKSVDFTQIKNTTEIWGMELSGDYIGINCTTVGDCYNVTIDETFTELVNGETYTVTPLTNSVLGQKLKLQDTTAYQIYVADGAEINYTPIAAGAMKAGVPYVLKYFEEKFVLQGELLIRCIVQEITAEPTSTVKDAYKVAHSCNNVQWIINPDSTFACTLDSITGSIMGEKRQVLTGGEYDNIYTTQLAYERASYENWLKCRQQDTVDIDMILVPWMHINNKIQYTSPVTGDVGTWLVKNISYDFSNWTMTVRATRFYPYYPFYEETENEETENDN